MSWRRLPAMNQDLNDSPAPLGSQPDAPHLCMAPRMPSGETLAKRLDAPGRLSWRLRNHNAPRSSCTPAERRKRLALSGKGQMPAVEAPPQQACSRQSFDAPLFTKLPQTTLVPAPPEESTPLTAREESVHEDQSHVSKAPDRKGHAYSRLLILPPNARRACAEAPVSPEMHLSPEMLVSPYYECPGRSPDTQGTPDAVNQRRYRGKASPASFQAAVPSALMRPARFAQPQQLRRQHLSGTVHSATKRVTVPTSCRSHRISGKSWVVSPEESPLAEVEKGPRRDPRSSRSPSKILFKIPTR